jgi:release factor glutamine methyltransferase
MTGAEALRAAIPRLRAAGVDDPAGDARRLLAHAMGLPPDRLTLHLPDPMTAPQASAYESALVAREARQPVAQILGERVFWGFPFRVTSDTLDPRPETETLVEEALRAPFDRMLDLGTGTGCILIACLLETGRSTGLGLDASAAALAVAAGNARRLGVADRAAFRQASWLDPDWTRDLGRFDLLASNPPYIAEAEMPALAPEVRDWEPRLALTPGGDGLDAYRAIAAAAPGLLAPGGRLLLEIGPTQGRAVAALLASVGLADIRILPDLDGRDRVVAARAAG